jgi:hypothetical protein
VQFECIRYIRELNACYRLTGISAQRDAEHPNEVRASQLSIEGRATVSALLGLLRNAPMTRPYAMPFAVDSWTSAAGQKRRFGDVRTTSALPPKTDIHREAQHVSKVPRTDIQVHAAVCTQMAGVCSIKSSYVSISFMKMNGTR